MPMPRHTRRHLLVLVLLALGACAGHREDPARASRPAPPPMGEPARDAGSGTAAETRPPSGEAAALRRLAADAYVAGYPILVTCRMALALAKTRGFLHQRRPLAGADLVLRTPENDGPLSTALVDAGGEAVVLTLPAPTAAVRLLVQVDDLNGRTVAVQRLMEETGRAMVLALVAGDAGSAPEGFDRVIRLPGRCALVSIRWFGDAPDGVLAEAQGRCRLRGLADHKGWASLMTRRTVEWPVGDEAGDRDPRAFPLLATLLRLFPVKAEPVLRERLARLGLDGTWDAATRAALQAGIDEARMRIADASAGGDAAHDGWLIPDQPGDGDLTARAAAVARGLGCADPQACLDAFAGSDRDGQVLDGARRYVLRFPAGQLPATDGGWSLTAHEVLSGLPDDGPGRRPVLGSRTAGLQYVADGSLTIYIQHRTPGPEREPNWLPTPAGRFRLGLHLRLPRDGTCRWPGVRRL